ncbi:hypothetical protein E2P81_ATG09543 [Venturia nashicola]|uniref:Uncharacterized protein n=1 Tax=Venturia nashicola TaxID=86259 RepID=A0A4Z1NUE5_9PEZI|nr:hypothetical protein E6O75_ATG09751 [Venturia nashicola]TLD25886.1 hypothetical protein E2P81_ATG09543 [Venturia nashicola]
MSNHNNNNNGYPPSGIPPGWVFYPYPPVVVYPHHQIGQASQELSLPAPAAPPALSIAPPPPPEPARLSRPPSEASPEPNEHNQLALPAQIKFVACHHCGTCGRPRSHAYHKEHPLIPGQVAPASTCRKCIKRQDKGEPIDSIMLSMRSHANEKGSTRSGQFYDPPSSEPSRGRVRSVSWRHVAPRAISRPRIESLDGFTNDSLKAPPPPAPSAPRSRTPSKLSRAASSAGSRANSRRDETHYRVRFERSPSQQRHDSVKRDQQDLTPYFRHVIRPTTDRVMKRNPEVVTPEVEKASSVPKSLGDIANPKSGSKVTSDYEAYRAYHSRPPTPPAPTVARPPAPSPPFGRGSFVGDPVGPWLNPRPHDNIAFSERSVNGSETTVETGRRSARMSRYMDI